MFEFNVNELFAKDYRTDPRYNKSLDRSCELKISKKDSEAGAEKDIKVRQNVLVCKKGCSRCKKKTDKIYNLLENNCGELKKVNMLEKLKIPKGVKDGQAILVAGRGNRDGDKYGNLIVTLKIK